MNIIKNFLTKNRCYKNATKIKVTKLVLHSLGVAQPCADGIMKSMNSILKSVCVHGFIETDRTIQTLPWDYKAWHVGSGTKGSYNNCAIGVEICEPKGHKYKGGTMIGYDVKANEEYFHKVYNNAVELFAYLCEKFDLNPLIDIYCHCEVHQIGYGSNHSDVMQWFPKHGKSMDTFRKDVKAKMLKQNVKADTTKTSTTTDKEDNIQFKYYTVKQGDTLGRIANQNDLTLNELLDLNKAIKNPNDISIGQKVVVEKYILYKVVGGDSLSKIAKKLLDDADRYKEIMKLNNLETTTINVGQVLKVPVK